ncbi:DUF3857 domain-containing protein [Seonamhaeicola algicola]|nr:DUF3857 domain-containing protein [Seonamhaeicola algicola]
MKKFYTITFFLIGSFLSFSQTENNKANFQVSLSDLEMKNFEKDTTANAVVLYEYGNSFVNPHSFKLQTEEKHKIKILNKAGFKNAKISIHLYKKDNFNTETYKDINATTYNLENGKITTTNLDKKDIYKEEIDENNTLIKFTLPNLKEGSVITYSFTKTSPFMFNFYPWNFQSDIPKLYSEYNTSIPANWKYHIKLVGGKKLSTNENSVKKDCLRAGNGGVSSCFVSKYTMENIPAFIEEDYMTTKYNYLARIEYELESFAAFDGYRHDYTKSWKDVDKELKSKKTIGKQISKSIKVNEILPLNIQNESDLLKKAQAIYSYMQNNYTWNGEFRVFNDVSIKDLLKKRSGNATAINILLKIFLEESGINTQPILLSTRNNGFASKTIPVISEFNYFIVQASINNKTYLLDATDDYLTFGQLPYRCLNHYARLLDFENGSKWIDIPLNQSNIQYAVVLNLTNTDSIKGKAKSRRTGYHALKSRKSYFKNEDAYIEDIQNNFPYIEITNHKVTSKNKNSDNFIEEFDLEYENNLTSQNLYINPFIINFFDKNPFKLQERTYPIDFGYKSTFFYSFKINIPDNYELIEKPKNTNLILPNKEGQVLMSSVLLNNTLNITFKLNFNQALYPPEYYPYLKKLMSKVVEIQTNSFVVLRKK